jgi:hypothetical protein
VEREQLAETEVGGPFDAPIELDERHPEPAREPSPDRRLTRSAQAQQRDDSRGSRTVIG